MTEKQFSLREPAVDYNIGCSEISNNGKWITYGEIVELLNKLCDENEELKREIKKFKKLWADTFMENAELKEKIDKSNKRFVKKLNTIQKQWG